MPLSCLETFIYKCFWFFRRTFDTIFIPKSLPFNWEKIFAIYTLYWINRCGKIMFFWGSFRFFFYYCFSHIFHNCLFAMESMPQNGSSNTINLLLPQNAIAIANFLLSDSDNSSGRWLFLPSSPIQASRLIYASMFAFSLDVLICEKKATCSNTVRCGKNKGSCGHTPSRPCASGICVSIELW